MSFASIKGHVQQIAMLKSALKRETVAHAYLFSGISGIGKMTVARAFAKALNCSAGVKTDYCDSCTSCLMINTGTHPDVQTIQPNGDFIKITQIRDMQDRLAYTRYYESNRVVLIDRAEAMNLQSANSLLKTIEEPPKNTVIILLTSLPYRIPATIRSRCQKVAFQPLSSRHIEESLLAMLGPDISGTHRLIARIAGGSLDRALRWQESGMRTRRQRLIDALFFSPDAVRMSALLDCTDELGEDREELLELCDLLRLWLRDVMIAKETGSETELLNIDLADAAMETARRFAWSSLFRRDLLIAEAQAVLKAAVNPKLTMEQLMLALSHDVRCSITESSNPSTTVYSP